VRTLLHCFAAQGLAALHPQPTGFPSDLARRQRIEEALDRLLGRPQVWTVTTLSEALAAEEAPSSRALCTCTCWAVA
jgi:hypothetical protein